MTCRLEFAGRYTIVLMLTITCGLKLTAQDSLTNKLAYIAVSMDRPAVLVGQHLPIDELGKIINYKLPVVRISELKGKAIILDFWHQWCTSCLEEFPKLEEMQKEFGDKLLILPVTFQSEKSVREFMIKRDKMGKPFNLPSIVEDTLLRKLFPHDGDPHEVWIDGDGIVRSITEAQAITKENIMKVIKGEAANLEQKTYSYDFNPRKPFLVNGNGGPDSFFYYRSMITGYIDSIKSGGFQRQHTKERTRLFIANTPVLDLYMQAYAYSQTNPIQDLQFDQFNKRIIYETRDSSKFSSWDKIAKLDYNTYVTTKRNRLFCYELIMPGDTSHQSAYAAMIQDLDRFFQLKSAVQKRPVRHFILRETNGFNKLTSSGKKQEVFLSEDKMHIRLINRPITDLVRILQINFNLPIILNAVESSVNVDLQLDFEHLPDIQSFQKQLAKCGLSLVQSSALIDMLVLRDLNMNTK